MTDSGVRRIGDYEVIRELARGGMGVVYHARQPELGRDVAIKLLLSAGGATPAELERFRREAQALARLQHPHVVPLHDVGQHEGQPYLVLALVPGRSLQDLLDRGGPLDPRQAARICMQLAQALESAHAQGVLHRDLKPANVLLDESGRPLLTDFGLARLLDDEARMTQTGALVGTPGFLAPEQIAGNRADTPAVDVYGLGATLYALLTGTPPFSGRGMVELLAQVATSPPTPIAELRAEVPASLEQICLRCLEKDPARRYRTAAELSTALRAFFAGESPRARRWLAPTFAALGVAALTWVVLAARRPAETRATGSPLASPSHERARPSPERDLLWELETGQRWSAVLDCYERAGSVQLELRLVAAVTVAARTSSDAELHWEVREVAAGFGLNPDSEFAPTRGPPPDPESEISGFLRRAVRPFRCQLDLESGRLHRFQGLEATVAGLEAQREEIAALERRLSTLSTVNDPGARIELMYVMQRLISEDHFARALNALFHSDRRPLAPWRQGSGSDAKLRTFFLHESLDAPLLQFQFKTADALPPERPVELRGEAHYSQGRLRRAELTQRRLDEPHLLIWSWRERE